MPFARRRMLFRTNLTADSVGFRVLVPRLRAALSALVAEGALYRGDLNFHETL